MLDCMNGLILNFYFHLNILLIPTIDERVDQRTHFNRRTVVALSKCARVTVAPCPGLYRT